MMALTTIALTTMAALTAVAAAEIARQTTDEGVAPPVPVPVPVPSAIAAAAVELGRCSAGSAAAARFLLPAVTVGRLFPAYAAADRVTASAVAASAAAFHWRKVPSPADVAAAEALPAAELNGTLGFMRAALAEHCGARPLVPDPPAPRPIGLLGGGAAAVDAGGYFVNPADGAPAFLFGHSQMPVPATAPNLSSVAGLGVSLTTVQLLPAVLFGNGGANRSVQLDRVGWLVNDLDAAAAAGLNVNMFLSNGRPVSSD